LIYAVITNMNLSLPIYLL